MWALVVIDMAESPEEPRGALNLGGRRELRFRFPPFGHVSFEFNGRGLVFTGVDCLSRLDLRVLVVRAVVLVLKRRREITAEIRRARAAFARCGLL